MTTPSSPAVLTLDQIEAAAAKLSTDERDELVRYLIDLDEPATPDVEAAWDQEIARRLAEVRSGKIQCVPLDEVMAEMKAEFCK